MNDLIIKNGTVYDGTGDKPFVADIAIKGRKIEAIGELEEVSKQTINAEGKIVAPGFVDIHTHYDGQVTWDPYLRPSTYHGVTTVVMGNCGVGFSPCKPNQRDWLIGLMEGVEDIPGTALHEGIDWDWETFPEFFRYISPSYSLSCLVFPPVVMPTNLLVSTSSITVFVFSQSSSRITRRIESTYVDFSRVSKGQQSAGFLPTGKYTLFSSSLNL